MTDGINYLTLVELSREMGIPASSLKVKLWWASKNGVPLPPRKRIGKCYLYDAPAFRLWLWKNADLLRRPFGASDGDEE